MPTCRFTEWKSTKEICRSVIRREQRIWKGHLFQFQKNSDTLIPWIVGNDRFEAILYLTCKTNNQWYIIFTPLIKLKLPRGSI